MRGLHNTLSARVASLRPAGQAATEGWDFTGPPRAGGNCANEGDTFVDAGPSGDVRYHCVNSVWTRDAAPANNNAASTNDAPAANNDVAQGVLSTIGAAIGASGPAIAAAITSGNQVELARIRAEAQRFRDSLIAQGAAGNPALAAQLLATNSLLTSTTTGVLPPMFRPAPGPSPLLIAGVLGVAAIGVYFLVIRRRS